MVWKFHFGHGVNNNFGPPGGTLEDKGTNKLDVLENYKFNLVCFLAIFIG
jgi:hypothetical protein